VTAPRWDSERLARWAFEAAGSGPRFEQIAAATVVLLRDTPAGIETLMVRRTAAASFMGGAWVFPGGKVDPEDWPAGAPTDSPVDELAAARTAAVREAEEEAGVAIEPDGLVWFAHWTPPPMAPRRFATWFFVAPASEAHDVVTIDGHEITEHAWLRPSVVLERHAAGDVDLAPPTWVTLHRLTAFATVEDALADAGGRPPDVHVTQIGRTEGGAVALWAGDAGYPEAEDGRPDVDAVGPRHRLWMTKGAWRYERSEERRPPRSGSGPLPGP
jgi:8-oxo-dGTP pyrophosphatase MutT (NUDIX family)